MSAGAVTGVGHVTTVLGTSTAAGLFASLSRLGLTVAWGYAGHGNFAAGGVRLGNVTLEVIGVRGQPPDGWPEQSVSFAPLALTGLVAELDRRGVVHGPPQPFRPDGGEPRYIAVALPALSSPVLAVQLSAYPAGRWAAPGAATAGVLRVQRVVIGTTDPAGARARWAALLGPPMPGTPGSAPGAAGPARGTPGGDCWRLRHGPLVEVRSASRDSVLEMVLAVRSAAGTLAAFAGVGLPVSDRLAWIGTLPACPVDDGS